MTRYREMIKGAAIATVLSSIYVYHGATSSRREVDGYHSGQIRGGVFMGLGNFFNSKGLTKKGKKEIKKHKQLEKKLNNQFERDLLKI